MMAFFRRQRLSGNLFMAERFANSLQRKLGIIKERVDDGRYQ
jgi:hypothetical protein